MYKILVVDDEAKIRELISKYAAFEGHTVEEASCGLEAINMCRKKNYDIVILDIMMPDLDGFSVCREIRKSSAVPIIMLSARGEEYDRIHGFETGVDDYVVKPFSPKELMLRINAVLKRTSKQEFDTVSVEGLTVDFTARLVYVDGQKVDLTPKEYDLLFYLVKNKNIALSRDKLICDIWG